MPAAPRTPSHRKTPSRRLGAPPKIDQQIEGPHGTTTVSARILELLERGIYIETAAAETGIHRLSVHDWLRVGRKVRERPTTAERTAHEQACLDFSIAVEQAEAKWEITANSALALMESGGMLREIVTEKIAIDVDDHGNQVERVLERTTRTETLLPDVDVIKWRLTRKHPDRYSERREISGPDGGPVPIDVKATEVTEALLRFLEAEQATDPPRPARRSRRKPPDGG